MKPITSTSLPPSLGMWCSPATLLHGGAASSLPPFGRWCLSPSSLLGGCCFLFTLLRRYPTTSGEENSDQPVGTHNTASIQVLNKKVHDDHRLPGLIANLEKFWDLNNEGAKVAEIIDQTGKSVWTAGGRGSDEICPNLMAESCTMPPKIITENLVAYFSN